MEMGFDEVDMLYLGKEEAGQLVEHSEKQSPNEACGILAGLPAGQAGKDVKVEKIFQMTNTDESAKTFFMDPKEQLKVMKEIKHLEMKMVGIYHSHLETEAYPSAHDVELAFYPEVSYVIVSIKDRDNPSIRSFRIIEGKISEDKVKIEALPFKAGSFTCKRKRGFKRGHI